MVVSQQTIKCLDRLLIWGLTSSVAAMREFPVATLDLARGKNDAAIIKCSFRICLVLSETGGPILSVRDNRTTSTNLGTGPRISTYGRDIVG